MVIKNLENKIKLVGIICSAFLMGCIIISVSSIWTARCMVTDAQQKVYVLDGNVPILVNRTTMEETLDVEAKSHIEMFHHYFFTLAPDDKYIRYSMEKAMYLVDETGLAQYNTLKEKGFYNNIMGTSAVFSIFCDSIKFNKEKMEFTYYGRQRIERRSNILMRELVTAGQVKARGGTVVAIITKGNDAMKDIADHCLEVPDVPECLTPLVVSVPLQLLAYYIAINKDRNVDQPRNLAKSVTVE